MRLEAEEAAAAVFFRALRGALPEDVLFSWDGGDFAHWGRAILPARHAGGWLRLSPLGTIGSSLPNAITGDGALGFYLAEMDTAFGGDGESIERPDEDKPALARAFASGVPY